MKHYCLALDLKDDEHLIQAYIEHHQNVWPEVLESIEDAGIEQMEIFNVGNRLFMIINTLDSFSFERMAQMNTDNPKVNQWEELMWTYQQALPFANPNEKWVLMNSIFKLKE